MSEKIYRVQMNSKGMPNFSTAVEIPQGWIPCSERLPRWDEHVDEMVLVCYGNGSVRFNTFMNGQWCQGHPLAWMPIPDPWKGADDETE